MLSETERLIRLVANWHRVKCGHEMVADALIQICEDTGHNPDVIKVVRPQVEHAQKLIVEVERAINQTIKTISEVCNQ